MALLIVITLLAFLVVLLVGLATYARVETSIAGNTQRQAQARENALLALNVALSQLQRHAGPDQRVTATADAVDGVNAQKRHYAGVWDATSTDNAPRAWLVSGIETGTPVDVAASIPAARRAELVGTRTAGAANSVVAALQDISTTGVPGTSPTTPSVIGRYAWWVGDQGVKAPVAVPDTSSSVTGAPFDSAELRARIRQQMAIGGGAADASTGAPVFEPRDNNNTNLVANHKVTAANQIAFLKNSANAALGLTRVQQNFHQWSPNNIAVLANTKLGGLRQDLSIAPGLLGEAFRAWANYSAYMEPFAPAEEGSESATTDVPKITPPYGPDPLRRRYKLTPPVVADGAIAGVAPVIAMCGLSFNIRTVDGDDNEGLEVRARWYVSLWNPYSSALVPEDLRLEIEGLPDPITYVITDAATDTVVATEQISLSELFADASNSARPFSLNLKWPFASATDSDYQSWLPGRVYTWISNPHSVTPTPPGGLDGRFYVTNFPAVASQGDTRRSGGPAYSSASNRLGSVSFSGPVRLNAKLYRAADTNPLATFVAPEFIGVTGTAPQVIRQSNYQFGFQFRFFESGHVDIGEKGAWLAGSNATDLRHPELPSTAFRLDPSKADDPAQYQTDLDFAESRFLLDRKQGTSASRSYNEDVPVFELPRSPILSLGTLQHLQLTEGRAFTIGNSWNQSALLKEIPVNQLFDRFFFSGVVDGATPTTTSSGDLILPNPLLKPLRKADGTKPTIDDLRGTIDTAESKSSKYLLQGGAFNLNSTSTAAWAAVLRGVRFPAPQVFSYLNVDPETGTADDTNVTPEQSNEARFFRFSQSAQETFKAEPGLASDDPENPSPANTHLFRQGMRTLSAEQVAALAARIRDLVIRKHTAEEGQGGPFRSVEEFLSPSVLFAGADADGNALAPRSLLEAAIEDAGLNADIAEFSSQWLTQADIMTALAPVLFARSDTFIIRTYGEVVNPATLVVEGRAWCEATVQRVPDYFDPSDPPETAPNVFAMPENPDDENSAPTSAHQLNGLYGRRFKVVSFRWLTRSDI